MSEPVAGKFNSAFVKIAIIIFALVVVIIPFYESKKVILWQSQDESHKYNIFSSFALQYAVLSEEIKKETRLDYFFAIENSFWSKIKESPVIFQPNPAVEERNIQVDPAQVKILMEEIKKQPLFNLAYNFWLTMQTKSKLTKEEQFEKLTLLLSEEIKRKTGLDISFFVQPKPIVQEKKQIAETPINNVPAPVINKQINQPIVEEINPNAVRYLIVGDSFMAIGGGLGDVVEKAVLNYGNSTVKRYGVVSSGFSRPDYFDWNSEIRKLVAQYKPNMVIAMFGANDNQNLTNKDGNFIAKYGGQDWKDGYAKRVDDMLNVFKENNAAVFWAGLPIMREKWFSDEVGNLNSIYEAECQKYQNAYFISTWKILANDKGNYTAYLKDKQGKNELARIRDGIHLTYFGAALVTEEISKKIEEVLNKSLVYR